MYSKQLWKFQFFTVHARLPILRVKLALKKSGLISHFWITVCLSSFYMTFYENFILANIKVHEEIKHRHKFYGQHIWERNIGRALKSRIRLRSLSFSLTNRIKSRQAQCVNSTFFVQKLQILEKLEKWSIYLFVTQIDYF